MMSQINSELKSALGAYLLALGDDELILGHRDSEWCSHAPILEEDIAFANLALDEIGHASLWYGLYAELAGEDPDTYPDRLAFFRRPEEYRSIQLVELPNGDWAFSMLRQFLFDAAEKIRLEALADSAYAPLAEAAAKVRREEIYHYRHTQAWMKRLGLGTSESRERLQNALNALWPYTNQLFAPAENEKVLATEGFIPDSEESAASWSDLVVPFLKDCGVAVPEKGTDRADRLSGSERLDRRHHTPHLKTLLSEMQAVARAEPQAAW